MGRTYQQALRISKDRQALLESQRNWLTQRDAACTSVTGNLTWSCILDATRSRITALIKIATTNPEQSPAPQAANSISSTPTQSRSETATEKVSNSSAASSSESQKSTVASNDGGSSLIVAFAFLIGVFLAVRIHHALKNHEETNVAKRRGKARDQSTDRSRQRSLLNSVDIC
ncbi:cobalamin biosynthesis Mg chelatase CobN [Bradyrhizobium sp. F1.13.1]